MAKKENKFTMKGVVKMVKKVIGKKKAEEKTALKAKHAAAKRTEAKKPEVKKSVFSAHKVPAAEPAPKKVPASRPVVKKAAPAVKAPASVKPAAKPTVRPVSKPISKPVEQKPAAAKVSSESSSVSREMEKAAKGTSFSPEYLVLMQRDPNFIHAFWDVSEKRIREATSGDSKLVLRLYDVSSDLTVRRAKLRKFRDIEIPADARSWYVQNTASNDCAASLGAVSASGEFSPIVSASPMQTFNFEQVGGKVNSDNPFFKASLGAAGIGGFGSSGLSSATVVSWLERLASSSSAFSSGSLSSGALSSGSLLAGAGPDTVNYGKDFFLWVKTRLIVYGGTRPDAHLQVRGEPFPLKPDGTFSFEQDLPDSTQVIPVFATDKDGDFPTTIVPVVVKRTE
jgi:hypothetical protein